MPLKSIYLKNTIVIIFLINLEIQCGNVFNVRCDVSWFITEECVINLLFLLTESALFIYFKKYLF